jgi:hypothetical protein
MDGQLNNRMSLVNSTLYTKEYVESADETIVASFEVKRFVGG